MGFRSTFVSEEICFTYPEWFKEKYKDYIIFTDWSMIASNGERKLYGGEELCEDVQKVVQEQTELTREDLDFCIAFLSEDGVISKCRITRTEIKYYTLFEWKQEEFEVDNVWNQGY